MPASMPPTRLPPPGSRGSWSRTAPARSYVERRGLDRQQAVTFQLGYAPDDRQGLRRALLDKGFTETELLAAGLLAMAEDDPGRGSFDRFRNRLMFPIADERGRIVGFGGRALGDARAKYLNTPETALFHKGELLYNLHRAAPAARQRREIVLAEGYMDVIALARAGLEHAVAPLGTAVTERQLGLLWRYAEAPIVCLDGDRAGLGAALRAAERALPLMQGGRSLRFALLPEGEDPDSYLARHGGAALAAVLARAQSLSQTLWRLETQGRRFEAPEDQAGLAPPLARLHPPRRRSRPAGEPGWPLQPAPRRPLPAPPAGLGEGEGAGPAEPTFADRRFPPDGRPLGRLQPRR